MAPLGTQISYALKARGVDVVFGIPGVHNQELYRGLEEAGLRHILARHEQGAGFMADGYARATGRAGQRLRSRRGLRRRGQRRDRYLNMLGARPLLRKFCKSLIH